MQIVRHYPQWPSHLQGGVVAIGNFDGVHRGHQEVLRQTVEQAAMLDVPAIVMSFEPHPRRFFQPDAPNLRVMPFTRKAAILRDMGVSAMLAQRFNQPFSQLDAASFMKDVLHHALQAQLVITGEDFIFGYQRSGNAESLRQYASQTGAFDYRAVPEIGNQGEGKFSSSKIREHIRQGEMRHAANLLGRPYDWMGCVLHGDKRGRTLGFPTANMLPPPVMLPRFGVYAVRGRWDNTRVGGVANLGTRPTVGGQRVQLEVHWFDVDADLYGKKLQVQFIEHLRDEKPFDGLDALKAQIALDSAQARDMLMQ